MEAARAFGSSIVASAPFVRTGTRHPLRWNTQRLPRRFGPPAASQSELKYNMKSDEVGFPRIVSSRKTRLSNWVTLVERHVVVSPGEQGAIYHSLDTMDSVSVLALTTDNRVSLVRQFRPAVSRFTMEFPGGMRESDETLETCAIREVAKEVGLAISSVQPLVTMNLEAGRLGNRMWTFFARDAVPIPGWRPSQASSPCWSTSSICLDPVRDGSFDNGPHLAMLGVATIEGFLPGPPP
jgi:8-oxo-dGTP pyrophosphatase MutT (NUDIX family)